MTYKTPHYGLIAFELGDAYSAAADKSRFTIIDNQLSFLAEQIGDGVIDGWEITASGNNVIVSPGMGIIDGFLVVTYSSYVYGLPNNRKLYMFMQRKPNIIADVGAYCDPQYVDYSDGTPPSTPATPTINSIAYDSVSLIWTANTELDLAYYNVYRVQVTSGISSSSAASPYQFIFYDESTSNQYVDDDVDQNTTYIYKISAVDINGQESNKSAGLIATTPIDVRIPSDPTNVNVLIGNQTLQIYWDASNFLVNSYQLSLQEITLDGKPLGSPYIVNVPDTTFYYIFDGLINGQLYQINISAVSYTGILSTGINGRGMPAYSGGSSELKSISASDISLDSSFSRIALNLSWELQDDEYALMPDYYLVTINRIGEVGVPSIYTNTSNTIVIYTASVASQDVTRDIEQQTTYLITIQTVSGDIQSNGFTIEYRTRQFSPPLPISNLTISTTYNVNTRSVVASWNNSVSNFAYNTITINKIPLNVPEEYINDDTINIANNLQYGQSNSYTIKSSDIENFYRYDFYVTVYDAFGNASDTIGASAVIDVIFPTTSIGGVSVQDSGIRPPVPTQQYCVSGNDQSTIYWNAANSDFTNGYRVYRANFSNGYTPADFAMVANLPASIRKFNDYTVDNGSRYVYFVTTVDVFGNESPNPADGYIFYTLLYVAPVSHSDLTQAPAISVNIVGNDAILTWHVSDNAFDGYQIFRSFNNLYSFKAIGFAGSLDSSFTDSNALLANGRYYYMMRKFRNEASIFASNSQLAPAGTLALGIVARNENDIIIDQSKLFSIKLLEGPIKKEFYAQLATPTDLFYSTSDDRRIRLQDNLIISDWTTTDYQTYTTQYNITGTTTWIAYINGSQSPYNIFVDQDNQSITFEQVIYTPSAATTAPAITVIFPNVSEVTGALSTDNIEPLQANMITQGILSSNLLPQIDHLGRYREVCTPQSYAMTAVSPQQYSGQTPSGITFYDLVKTPDERIVAATSQGVMATSYAEGIFTTVLTGINPANRIIYSPYLAMYFVSLIDKVQISSDLINWQTISGMDGVSFVRDIVSDEQGSIYASTDAGVYLLQPLAYTKLFWTQLSFFDPNDSNVYGLAYYNNLLYASGSSGIYTNDGTSWSKITAQDVQIPIHSISFVNNYIFLVGNNKILRKGPTDSVFNAIGNFDVACRKGCFFASTFYITTDNGLYCSSTDSNLFNDSLVIWQVAFNNIAISGLIPITYGLKVIEGRLWLGQDNIIYSITTDRSLYTNADIQGICPTIYIDNTERSVGVYYGNNKVFFDARLTETNIVTIVRDYTVFTAPNGGWADTKYDAEVVLTINGSDILGPNVTKLINGKYWSFPPNPWTPPTDPATILGVVSGIITPYFNGRNSNFDLAIASLTKIVQAEDAINVLNYYGVATSVPADMVSTLMQEIDRFKTYIHPQLRSLIVIPALNGTISYNGFNATYDVMHGTITIIGGLNKYSTVALTVKGVAITNIGINTHDQLEAVFDNWNSGLVTPMALVQQSNLIKLGIYQERIEPGGLKIGGFSYQAEHYTPNERFYDPFLSTIDYVEKIQQLPTTQGSGNYQSIGFSIDYPADTIYIQDIGEVWVCGDGGIIAIDTTTFDTREVYNSEFYVYNMSLSSGIIYILAEDGIYTIDPYTGDVEKDINDVPLENATSIFVTAGTMYLATSIGVYSKRQYETSWTNVFYLGNALMRSSPMLTFAVGEPITLISSSSSGTVPFTTNTDTSDSLVYYSYGGIIWNQSNQFQSIKVNGVAQQYNTIYFATDNGLLQEDSSGLFYNLTVDFTGPSQSSIQLSDEEDSNVLYINDVDADANRVIAGTDTGMWYSISGNTVDGSGQSRLETIHKVRVVNGNYWLFCNNLIEIENNDRLIQLSTGKALY